MNLGAMKALCHGGRRAHVYESVEGGQWISNGRGAWLVEDIRIEDDGALMSLWNLSEKARSKAVYLFDVTTDKRFTWRQTENEEALTEIGMVALSDVAQYIALLSPSAGLMFIDAALLRPVRGDYRQYYARWEEGRPIIAVYDDLIRCVALILPIGNTIAEDLRMAAEKMAGVIFHWPDEKKDAEDAAADAEAAAEALLNRKDDGEETEEGA